MIVICFEGCHGSGKTKICGQLWSMWYNLINVEFMDSPDYGLDRRGLIMECMWETQWIEAVLEQKRKDGDAEKIYISDRSPYSAVRYGKRNKDELEAIITAKLEEMAAQANIHVYTVHLRVSEDTLWRRIENRLATEPERKKYGEEDRLWMETIYREYNDPDRRKWDFTVDNEDGEIDCVVDRIRSEIFPIIYKDCGLDDADDKIDGDRTKS